MSRVVTSWPLHSEHSGALLRLRRLVERKQTFVLCFLTYSDRAYRETAAGFLAGVLGARLRVAIDRDVRVGTEDLFGRLSDPAYEGPAQLIGLESWPDGLGDLLTRLNYRREAFAARCQRPVLIWIRKRDVRTVTTGAADLWAWRSGVFDFSLPEVSVRAEPQHVRTDRVASDRPARQQRLVELQRHLRARPSLKAADVELLLELGDLQDSFGHAEAAEQSYSHALTAVSGTDDRRRRAMAQGRIANLLETRGDLDEALRIRREEEIPVYERLGDERSLAITRGKIADILATRGDLDEALRIRSEEQIPVYERLRDVRSLAIARGKIADILQARGDLDEALRIRREEEIPVYERIGDVRELAITRGKIADILQARGDLDEALRIRREEEIPVYERIGDVRELAITRGKIADILQARGELDEALRIRREEQIPVYERLGDVHELAITRGQIADVLETRGDLDEALRIRREEEIPVYERLGDVRSLAITRGKVADILATRGDLDEALRIRREEEIPVYERLGDVRSLAIARGKIADILQARGELDEAQRIPAAASDGGGRRVRGA